jgi:hypothetical protein
MSAHGHQTPAEIRSHLNHPVIDGDGHWVEFDPVFGERMRKVGGDRAADGFLAALKTTTDALSMSVAERAMTELGIASNLFRVDCTQDVAKDLTKENLQNYDIVMFYTTGPKKNLPIPDDVLDYFFNDWLKQPGHGFIDRDWHRPGFAGFALSLYSGAADYDSPLRRWWWPA